MIFRERIQRKTGPMTMTGLSPTGTLKNIYEILQVYRKTFLKSYRYAENILQSIWKTFLKSYGYTENIADEKLINGNENKTVEV
jgi:hypothetical protein